MPLEHPAVFLHAPGTARSVLLRSCHSLKFSPHPWHMQPEVFLHATVTARGVSPRHCHNKRYVSPRHSHNQRYFSTPLLQQEVFLHATVTTRGVSPRHCHNKRCFSTPLPQQEVFLHATVTTRGISPRHGHNHEAFLHATVTTRGVSKRKSIWCAVHWNKLKCFSLVEQNVCRTLGDSQKFFVLSLKLFWMACKFSQNIVVYNFLLTLHTFLPGTN